MRVCFFVPTSIPDVGGIALNTHGLVLALEEEGKKEETLKLLVKELDLKERVYGRERREGL